jgi:hypothetical protein
LRCVTERAMERARAMQQAVNEKNRVAHEVTGSKMRQAIRLDLEQADCCVDSHC